MTLLILWHGRATQFFFFRPNHASSLFNFLGWMDRGLIGKFFWGGRVIFPDFFPGVKCFFPVENFHFGRPKTNVRRFEKWQAKTKQKTKQNKKQKKKTKNKTKKKSSPHLGTFPFLHFQFFTFPFTIFLLFFSIFPLFHFSLLLFSQ